MNGQQQQKDYGLYLTAIIFNVYGQNTPNPMYHAVIEFNDFLVVNVDIKKTKQGELFVAWPQSEFTNRNNQKQYKNLVKFTDKNAMTKVNNQILSSFAGGQCLNWVSEGSTYYARQQNQQQQNQQQYGGGYQQQQYPQQPPVQQYQQQPPQNPQYQQPYQQQAPQQPQQYPQQQQRPVQPPPYQQPAQQPQQYQQPPQQPIPQGPQQPPAPGSGSF